jgi:hypothetical protein
VIELRSELDRVVTFKGEWVNSAIVHGSDQRWAKDVLIAELRREEDIAAQKIMNAKVGVRGRGEGRGQKEEGGNGQLVYGVGAMYCPCMSQGVDLILLTSVSACVI